MDKQQILQALTPEIVAKFRTAIELDKWDNGVRLTDEQRHTCMQAVMVWEHEYLPQEERTGYIHRPKKNRKIAISGTTTIIRTFYQIANSLYNFAINFFKKNLKSA